MNRMLLTVFVLMAISPIGARQPAQQACNAQWPQWSPDGRSIVFSSDRTGDPEVYVLRLGDSEPRRLTETVGRDAHPSFSPDGRTIAFQSPRGDGQTNLYLMNADGSGQRRITSHKGFAGVPVFSSDGRTIAYQWTPELGVAKWRLMLLDVATSKVTELTDGSANDQVPNWSPDAARLVFYSDRTGTNQLYVREIRSGNVRRLTTSSAADQGAAWSADGRAIAFVSTREGTPGGIFIMNADGTGVRRLGSVAQEHGVPFYSPDGSRVLATPVVDGGTQIWAVSVADGKHQVLMACKR